MTEYRQLRVRPGVAITAMLAVLLVGAGSTYLLMRNGQDMQGKRADAPGANPVPSPPGASATARSEVTVTLTKDAVDRAGIVVTHISTQPGTDDLRLPGVVEPNAYRLVAVTPLVGGRVVGVAAQLGDHVRKGQRIAQVYSPELAEARTKYVAAKAMLDAHDRELQRTQKLVEIGAASRQELERIHAEHVAQIAAVESARSRLELLGAEPDESAGAQGSANANVTAPIDGVVTERLANVGLNVDPATKLFTIVDLSNVWVVADVYERDFQRVREGARATVNTTAFPDRPLDGKVGFIDPQLNATTRTAKIRVEVSNPRGDLRPGMYTDVTIDSAPATSTLTVPKEAVQSVGDTQVVYLSSSDGTATFTERPVRLGRAVGDQVEVLSGLSAGDAVVSKGSFSVRAEVERLGLRGPASSPRAALPAAESGGAAGVQTAKIAVTEAGFEPDRVRLRAGAPVRLTFIRTTDKTCGTEVVLPSMNIKRALPLNEPVVIEFTPANTGDVSFACGMNMLKGVVVVQ